ncbi:MAG TPA: flagellar assembly protein FliH [Steroidobacteraceae bacterium]|jgi:flagellar assembly protein FliH|nr:flagellar assembly protein FliH [Steroidobacteraceae bacterium]
MSDKAFAAAKAAAAVDAIKRWSLPSVEGPIIGRRVTEAEQRAAERANYEKGYQEGLAAAQAEVNKRIAELNARVQRLDAILKMMSRPLEDLDDEVEKQLTLLALTVGKQMVRRELKTDPAQVIAVIRECVGRLPVAARDVRVHLHPEDAAVVRELLSTPSSDRAWSIVEDPALSRGGCVVRTDTSQIDAKLDSRLNAVVAAAFGDERAPTRTGESAGG